MVTTVKDYEKLSEQYNKMIAERNSLIDDLSWYKAKVSRLERENAKHTNLLKNFARFIDYKLYIHPGNEKYMEWKSKLSEYGEDK